MNGYPKTFIDHSLSQRQSASNEERENTQFLLIPYVSGLSEDICRICREYNIRVSFKYSHTVRDCLTRVKDSLPTCMRSGTVYKVPCTCGKYYIGESIRRLETRLAEHKEACFKGDTHKSAIADHAWSEQHAIEWDNTTVIDRSSNRMNLMLKEALHIQLSPKQQQMNRDSGTDIPGCWVSTISGMSCSSAS